MDTNTELSYTRTHLANERTFAAWLRTGLAIAAAGFGVTKLAPSNPESQNLAAITGGGLLIFGAFTLLWGAWSFHSNYKRMSEAGAQATGIAPALALASGVLLAVALLAMLFLI